MVVSTCTFQFEVKAQTKPNVLFICVDDLTTTALGAYGGNPAAITPNIDRLASQGRVFRSQYVHAPVCGPSRAAMLTGRRIGMLWDVWIKDRQLTAPPLQPVSIGNFFKNNGYTTVSLGKVSHRPDGTIEPAYNEYEVPFSWDLATGPTGIWREPWRAFFAYAGGGAYNRLLLKNETPRPPYEHTDVEDTGYPDGLTAEMAIEQLNVLGNGSKPFFLAVGFYKPHLPQNVPTKYFDLYKDSYIGLAKHRELSKDLNPSISIHRNSELTGHYQWPNDKGQVSDEQAINQRHHYYACVSYVDAQIGKVIDALKQKGLDKNTIVVLWSDHGWHLGELGVFGKHTLYEYSARSPLIIRTPGMSQPGIPTEGIVESIDIYPTLAELANLPQPKGIDGSSFLTLLKSPGNNGKNSALTVFSRGKLDGLSLRTQRYRLIYWFERSSKAERQVELYDHLKDPYETKNIAKENQEIVNQLRKEILVKQQHK